MKAKATLLILTIICLILSLSLISCNNNETDTKITVSFDADGGSKVGAQIVNSGDYIDEPPAPTKDGYTFEGWYYGNKKWDFMGTIKRDITLTAKWTLTEYTITYINGSCVLTKYSPLSTYDLTKYEAIADKDNYTIEGWYLDEDYTKPITKIEKNTEGDLILYGKLSPLKYLLVNGEYCVIDCDIEAIEVTVPATYKGYPVAHISPNAFKGCVSLERVTLPEGLKTIEQKAFEGCILLEEINLPSTLESVASNAFYGCVSLTK